MARDIKKMMRENFAGGTKTSSGTRGTVSAEVGRCVCGKKF